MTDKEVNELAGFLWGGVIKSIDFNIHKNEIVFHICMHYHERTENHELYFLGVSTYYYVNNDIRYRKNLYEIEEDGYLEFTTLNYIEHMNISFSHDEHEWLKRYSSEANVYVEMWEKVLFIECTGIRIDNQIYMFNQMKKQ